jgi:alanyl-tRNA synthetase
LATPATLSTAEGDLRVVETTLALPGLHRHLVEGGSVPLPKAGDSVGARIDGERRAAIRRHHTATHLLHSALRSVLGDHVKQQGSLVTADRLRFDFSHFAALTEAQTEQIENLVNEQVLGTVPTTHEEMSKSEAENSEPSPSWRQIWRPRAGAGGGTDLDRVLRRYARAVTR